MVGSDGESELNLSPQVPRDDNAEIRNKNQCKPPSRLNCESPVLPPRSDEKEINFPPSQGECPQILPFVPQDKFDDGKVNLSSNDEDNEGLQTVVEMKESMSFSHDICDERRRTKSLCILTSSAGKAKAAQLSLDDSDTLRKKVSSVRKHRETEPNLTMKRKNTKHVSPALFFPPSQWSARYGIQFFTVVIPKVFVIKDYEKGSKGSYAVYQIEIKRGRQVIVRKYRYSQFADFHQALLRSSIAIILQQAKIYLPAKTWFKNVSPSFLDQRRQELEKYLHRLLQFKYSPREAIVQKFLALNEFVVKDFWIDH